MAFASRLAAERGIAGITPEAMESSQAMSSFIEELLAQPASVQQLQQQQPAVGYAGGYGDQGSYGGVGGNAGSSYSGQGGEGRPPSEKQVAFGSKLAVERGLEIPVDCFRSSQVPHNNLLLCKPVCFVFFCFLSAYCFSRTGP